ELNFLKKNKLVAKFVLHIFLQLSHKNYINILLFTLLLLLKFNCFILGEKYRTLFIQITLEMRIERDILHNLHLYYKVKTFTYLFHYIEQKNKLLNINLILKYQVQVLGT
ncbi:hypothetical protein ACJX0J_035853, partial [Zea mays]